MHFSEEKMSMRSSWNISEYEVRTHKSEYLKSPIRMLEEEAREQEPRIETFVPSVSSVIHQTQKNRVQIKVTPREVIFRRKYIFVYFRSDC